MGSYNPPAFIEVLLPKEYYKDCFKDCFKDELLSELKKGEAEINKKIKNTFTKENDYSKYGLLNCGWFEIFKLYLNNPHSLDRKQTEELFDFNNILPKSDKKDYSYINDRYRFSFPSNFCNKKIYVINIKIFLL